jgi:DNA-binding transcriptional MocR family regulator
VVEDDIYGELAFARERTPLVKGFDTSGWVMSCSSFSKELSAGFRIGWALPGCWYEEVLRRKRVSSLASSTAAQWTLAAYLEHGGYDRHLRRLRRTLHDNTQRVIRHVTEAFPEGTRVARPQGGFLLWVELPRTYDATVLKQAALRHGISIGPGALFGLDDRYDHCLRLNTGVPWSERMAAAIHTLGALAKEQAHRQD